MSQDNVRNLSGDAGGIFISPLNELVTGKFSAVQFTQDSVISSIKTNIDQSVSSLSGLAVPGGFVLFGLTSEISLSSGSAIAYNQVR